ncbi:hypothetical protein CUMW_185720 [Citrus unshiu]|nr:hypothetical protein CUMW_185720 [Citrus unshiu]
MHDLAELLAGIECSKIKLNYVIKHLHLLNLSSSRIEIDRANFHSKDSLAQQFFCAIATMKFCNVSLRFWTKSHDHTEKHFEVADKFSVKVIDQSFNYLSQHFLCLCAYAWLISVEANSEGLFEGWPRVKWLVVAESMG